MLSLKNITLQKKITLLVLSGLAISLGLFGSLGIQSLNENTRRILDERLDAARILANNIDENMSHTLAHMQNTASLNFIPEEWEFPALTNPLLHTLGAAGIYARSIIFIDKNGIVTRTNPEEPTLKGFDLSGLPEIKQAFQTGLPIITNQITNPMEQTRIVLAVVPFKTTDGETLGLLAALIDPARSSFRAVSQVTQTGNTGYIEIIDGNGLVLARTEPGLPPAPLEKSDHQERFADLITEDKAAVRTCHRCHETDQQVQRSRDILAFAPLSTANWGVGIRQTEAEALAPIRQLQTRFLLSGIFLTLGAIFLVWFLSKSIVQPLKALKSAAGKVASGDFEIPATLNRKDEIGELSQSFNTMTRELAKSRELLVSRNQELSTLNEARGQLLTGIINAQEDERKRISRELHDETGQNLTAAIFKMEAIEQMPPTDERRMKDTIDGIKSLLMRTLEDLRRLTQDLRPLAIDDIGLASAIRTYAKNRLEPLKIRVEINSNGLNNGQRLSPALETAVFRIAQEGANNIAKHSSATKAKISLSTENNKVILNIDDNGSGFEPATVPATGDRQPLGILGIKERVALLGGTFAITSESGKGTGIHIEIPAAYRAAA